MKTAICLCFVTVGLCACASRDVSKIYIGSDDRFRYYDPEREKFVLFAGEYCPFFLNASEVAASIATDEHGRKSLSPDVVEQAKRSPRSLPAALDSRWKLGPAKRGFATRNTL
jgi:hypothetical protein